MRTIEQRAFDPWRHPECIPLQKFPLGSRVIYEGREAVPIEICAILGSGEFREDGHDYLIGWQYCLLFLDGNRQAWVREDDMRISEQRATA